MKRYFNTFITLCGIILIIPIGALFGIVITTGLWWEDVNRTWKNLP